MSCRCKATTTGSLPRAGGLTTHNDDGGVAIFSYNERHSVATL